MATRSTIALLPIMTSLFLACLMETNVWVIILIIIITKLIITVKSLSSRHIIRFLSANSTNQIVISATEIFISVGLLTV